MEGEACWVWPSVGLSDAIRAAASPISGVKVPVLQHETFDMADSAQLRFEGYRAMWREKRTSGGLLSLLRSRG